MFCLQNNRLEDCRAYCARGGLWNREDLPEQRIVNVGTGQADIPAERPGEVHIGTALSEIFRSDTSP